MLSFVIIILVAATAATAHIFLKIVMNQVGEVNAEALKTPGRLVGQPVTTPAILAAIPVYAISNVGWLVVL